MNMSHPPRRSHILDGNLAVPTVSLGTAPASAPDCHIVGFASDTSYDAVYANGGCMAENALDFVLQLEIRLDESMVHLTLNVTYGGSQTNMQVYVFPANTEKVGAVPCFGGGRPKHVWRAWLLDQNSDNVVQLYTSPHMTESLHWSVPLNTVCGGIFPNGTTFGSFLCPGAITTIVLT